VVTLIASDSVGDPIDLEECSVGRETGLDIRGVCQHLKQ